MNRFSEDPIIAELVDNPYHPPQFTVRSNVPKQLSSGEKRRAQMRVTVCCLLYLLVAVMAFFNSIFVVQSVAEQGAPDNTQLGFLIAFGGLPCVIILYRIHVIIERYRRS